jgi:hypothetical protein
MRKIFATFLSIFLVIVLTFCFKNSNGGENDIQLREIKTDLIEKTVFIKTNIDSVLIENKVLHPFSQIDIKDEFYICIKGKSILEGTIIFKITKSDGTVLLYEEFPSNSLMGYEFEGDFNSEKEVETFIKKRIKEFFNETNFIYPAIKSDETFDEDYSDRDIWNEIKSDLTIIGFSYLIGEEDGRKIAYSKKKRKVVMYFNCC